MNKPPDMVLSIVNNKGQVLLQQPADLQDARPSGMRLQLHQHHDDPGILLSAYQSAGAMVWTGWCGLTEGFSIRIESTLPLLQLSLVAPTHPGHKDDFHLHEHTLPELHAGTHFSLHPPAGHYRLLLLYLSQAHLEAYPIHKGIGQLKTWLMQQKVPRDYQVLPPESGLLPLCNQLLIPPLQHNQLLASYLQLKVQELVLHLGAFTGTSGTTPQLTEAQKESLERVAAAIRDHLDQPLSVAALAKIAATSRPALQAQFKLYYGCTLRQYAYRSRMEAARKLIVETALSLKEIAYRTGYSDPDHFYAAFKQYYGHRAGTLRQEP